MNTNPGASPVPTGDAPPAETSTPQTDAPIEAPNRPAALDSDHGPALAIMESAPEVSPFADEHAPAAPAGPAANEKRDSGEPRDADGNYFDPAVHVTDDNGAPVLTKNGKLRRRPGRKAGGDYTHKAEGSRVETGRPAPSGPGSPDQAAEELARRQGARAAAIAAVGAVEMTGRVLGGDEWAMIRDEKHGIDERGAGIDAFAAYFEANGVVDIPPGVALAVWGISYAAPRFTMPKTQSRLTLARAWISAKWPFNRKRKKVHEHGSRSDSGNDRERKDNASGSNGGDVSG